MSDRLTQEIENAFQATCEAEAYEYAGGGNREIKDCLIQAHSALLRAKNLNAARNRKFAAA